MAPKYRRRKISIWRPTAVLNLQNSIDFLSNDRIEIHICQPNLIEIWWFAAEIWEIKLLSKWRPSAILNFRKLQFWSRDLHRHVILHLLSKFRINRPLWYRDIAKKPVVHVLQRLIWTGTLPWSENRTYSADCHLVVFPYWTQICTSFTILTVINIIIY